MPRYVVSVASRATGYVFDVYGPFASHEKASEVVQKIYREGQEANAYFGQDHSVVSHEIKPLPRGKFR